ncbi:MAG: type II and III secretion system protein family protein [Gammaproteobacteria bacterium]|nr:type II and III secretion system protein family protein [Gammaproteobacteria bacterium]
MRAHPMLTSNLVFGLAVIYFILALGLLFPGQAHGQPTVFSIDVDQNQTSSLQVPIHKSRVIQLQSPVSKISVGNPEIADILTLRSQQLYVLGKSMGATNVLLWDSADRLIAAINIEVTHDLDGLRAQVSQLFPGEDIKLHSAQGMLVLSGQANNSASMEGALRLANGFSGELGTLNLMTVRGPQQVMLEVKVAEVSRTLSKTFGADFNAIGNRSTRWSIGGVGGGALVSPGLDLASADPLTVVDKGIFANFASGSFEFNSVLNAAKDNGLAKILAEPTLTTMSGQEAVFLSGGEFPIPVPKGDLGITVEFKEFGIGVRFIPTVLDAGRINLKLNVSVSDLIAANNVELSSRDSSASFFVPALTKRSASSTVELADGQTIGIAGLISDSVRESVSKYPGLGDIPILGQLFKSKEFEKGETELVILVTPHLARPLPAGPVKLPTDNAITTPGDAEFYLLGRKERATQSGGERAAEATEAESLALDDRFGYVVEE